MSNHLRCKEAIFQKIGKMLAINDKKGYNTKSVRLLCQK